MVPSFSKPHGKKGNWVLYKQTGPTPVSWPPEVRGQPREACGIVTTLMPWDWRQNWPFEGVLEE